MSRYSFDFGAVHFVVISSEANYPGHPSNKHVDVDIEFGEFLADQLLWLKKVTKESIPS